MMRSVLGFFAFVLLAAAGVTPAWSQGKDGVHIRFAPIPTVQGAAGDTVWVNLTATVDKHWYTYSTKPSVNAEGLGPIPTRISIRDRRIATLAGAIGVPKAKRVYDEAFEVEIEKLIGTFTWRLPVRINPQLTVGTHRTAVIVAAGLCDTTGCLPETDYPADLTIEVTAAASAAAAADTVVSEPVTASTTVAKPTSVATPASNDAQAEIRREQEKGLLNFFLYAMGIGFLALLTPCVFPMIPITVSFFTKRNESTRGRALRDASLYGVGIISTFTAIGIIASIFFGATAVQDLSANPWVNVAIGLLFVVLAFNLFGTFEIQVPVRVMNALNRKAQGDSITAVLLMGFTFSLTSFTCTVPFVGTALLSAAGGSYLYPTVGMLGFATAFAIPFFFLALFPSLLAALPRAGGWMNNLKVVMGFLELAAAIKFFSSADLVLGLGILPRELFLAMWTGVCALIVIYLLGGFKMTLDSAVERVSGIRAFFAVVFATMAFWFAAGMLGRPLQDDLDALLPPENYAALMGGSATATAASAGSSATAGHGGLHWFTNLKQAKVEAKRTGKPIFIDFTGFTCTNCRLMEKSVFSKQVVAEAFKDFVLVQLYTDRKEQPYIANQEIMKTYGTVANPLYVVLRSDGSYVAQTGYQTAFKGTPQLFVDFLQQAR